MMEEKGMKSILIGNSDFNDYPSVVSESTKNRPSSNLGSGLEYSEKGEYDTLNEPVLTSLKRELVRIWNKTQCAIIPRCKPQPEKNLRQWDLWGPLFFTILLSYFISESNDTEEMSWTFCLVFMLMWIGGSVVTVNAILLGANVTLFQSLCVLGYCLFPILFVSIIFDCFRSHLNFFWQIFISIGSCVWACFCSLSFMGDIVGNDKKGLGIFPICLFYFSFSCYLFL